MLNSYSKISSNSLFIINSSFEEYNFFLFFKDFWLSKSGSQFEVSFFFGEKKNLALKTVPFLKKGIVTVLTFSTFQNMHEFVNFFKYIDDLYIDFETRFEEQYRLNSYFQAAFEFENIFIGFSFDGYFFYLNNLNFVLNLLSERNNLLSQCVFLQSEISNLLDMSYHFLNKLNF